MNKSFRGLLALVLILTTTQRLPAPIQELGESPTPAAAVESARKPKSRPSFKSKPNSEASESPANPASQQSTPKQGPFAGIWVGTMPEVPWGDVATGLVVDQTGTTMAWQESGKRKAVAKAQVSGNALSARFPAGFTTAVWYITPQPDGTTARVRLTAFMNDQTAVFQKETGPIAPPATPPQSTELPVAKPVPGKPGFVYNPFDPNTKILVDVRGHAAGSQVKDPKSGKLFIVP
jgi:hypothetical protein